MDTELLEQKRKDLAEIRKKIDGLKSLLNEAKSATKDGQSLDQGVLLNLIVTRTERSCCLNQRNQPSRKSRVGPLGSGSEKATHRLMALIWIQSRRATTIAERSPTLKQIGRQILNRNLAEDNRKTFPTEGMHSL